MKLSNLKFVLANFPEIIVGIQGLVLNGKLSRPMGSAPRIPFEQYRFFHLLICFFYREFEWNPYYFYNIVGVFWVPEFNQLIRFYKFHILFSRIFWKTMFMCSYFRHERYSPKSKHIAWVDYLPINPASKSLLHLRREKFYFRDTIYFPRVYITAMHICSDFYTQE